MLHILSKVIEDSNEENLDDKESHLMTLPADVSVTKCRLCHI